jgi:uncharacterized Zn-binding protein involved in type VI secretion
MGLKLLTDQAILVCGHSGRVAISGAQSFVTINGRRILVEGDPEAKGIGGCPNIGPTIKPCTSTLKVQAGYSTFVRINGRAVCLETVTGVTDGTPPGLVKYTVRAPGQALVTEE